jgi:hypothetical protein
MQPIVKTLVFVVAITFFALAVPSVQANSVQNTTQSSGIDPTKLPTTIFATEKGFFTGILTGKLGSTSGHNSTLPERATLLVLGGSLAGFATGARRRATRLKRMGEVSVRVPSESLADDVDRNHLLA